VRQSPATVNTARTLLRALLFGLALVLVLTGASTARAQSSYFYLDRAQISGAPDDGYMVWRPTFYDQTRFYGFAALGYSHNPLRDDTVTSDSET